MSKRHTKKPAGIGTEIQEIPIVQPSPSPTTLDIDWRTADPLPLSRELRTYVGVLDRLLSQKDDYVLIKGHDVIGIYPTRQLAILETIDRFEAESVLIKRIVATEPVLEIGHVHL